MRLLMITFLFTMCGAVWAQSETPETDNSDLEVEALYERVEEKVAPRTTPQRREVKEKQFNSLTDLGGLEPFNDIAVIQRRFLPRTQRFELSGSGMVTLNNPFFNNVGLALRGAYFFHEKYGVELQYFFLSTSERSVTEGLKDRSIQTDSLVTAKSYMGAAFKWNPMYGKITFMNSQVVPFDLHFTFGGGLTKTDFSDGETTIHLGSGQTFALSKAMAVRWDLVWNFYQAEAINRLNQPITTSHDDLFISIGVSYFIPEAKYR